MISPLFKRIGLLATGAVALTACDFGLVIDPELAAPGDPVTVSNADGPHCIVEEGEDGIHVDIVMITDAVAFEESGEFDIVGSTTTDAAGLFTTTIEAPDRPGQHLLVAVCGGVPEVIEELRVAAPEDPVDEDGVIVDSLRVTQAPLSVVVDHDEVNPGDEVTATFNRCQDENDFGLLEVLADEVEPTAVDTDEPELDFPDLDVYLDGALVETIAGDERYPTGTLDVPLELTELGEHEIKGICTYQTFDIDLEWIFEETGGGEVPLEVLPQGAVGTAAIDYPIVDGPLTLDETTTESSVTVVVVAGAVGGTGAAPVVAAPAYTG